MSCVQSCTWGCRWHRCLVLKRALRTTGTVLIAALVITVVWVVVWPQIPAVRAQTVPITPGNADNESSDTTWELLRAGIPDELEYGLTTLTYGSYQEIADSIANPRNSFLLLPSYTFNTEVRPDFSYVRQRLELSLKPRLMLHWRNWQVDPNNGSPGYERSEWSEDTYINEGLARVGLTDNLFISYGRENLQWGPSYLLSPSNPFFRDNGRRNPIQEVPGMDFARLVWLPAESWTISLIANTDRGRQPQGLDPFAQSFALKADWNGPSSYASGVLSHRDTDRSRIGLFGGWTATDAMLVYAESDMARGTAALYPQQVNNPLGGRMVAQEQDSNVWGGTLLLGSAYTLAAGPTLTAEVVYHSPGYSAGQAKTYYQLRRQAATMIDDPGAAGGLAQMTLGQTLDPGLRLLRRHYLMLQVVQNEIGDVLNLTGRWTQNFDDGSGQFIGIAEYYAGDHLKLFAWGTVNSGDGDTEFGALFNYQAMLGMEYVF